MPLLRFTPTGRALMQLSLEADGVDAVAGVDLSAEQARTLVGLAREAIAPAPRRARPAPTPDVVVRPGQQP